MLFNWELEDLLVMKVLALFKSKIGKLWAISGCSEKTKKEFRIIFILEDF
jgi:hypothetical protein